MGAGRPSVPPLRFKRIALIIRTVPLIRHASRDTFPQGKALRAADSRPYMYPEAIFFIVGAGHWPARIRGASRRPRPTAQHRLHLLGQARRGSGTAPAPIFHIARAQWPGGNLECHSDFARRKFCLDLQVCVPRNGGPGVRRIWTRSVHPEPSPGDSLVTFSSLRKSLAATAAKFPGATNPRDAARRVVAQASFSCPYGAIHLLAPYEKRNHCLPPAGGGTPCA